MKTLTLLLASFLYSLFLSGQSFNISNISKQLCPYDSTQSIDQLDDWDIYQTVNNQWDGDIIESCHRVFKKTYYIYLDLENIDFDKAIFIRSKEAPTNETKLFSNKIYEVGSYGNWKYKDNIDLQRKCGENLCSGVILGIEIPSEDSLTKTQRIHKLQYNEEYELNGCLPTEYFKNQRINEAIIKLTIDSIGPEQDSIRLPSHIYIYPSFGSETFDKLVIPSEFNQNNEYNVNITNILDNGWENWFLGLHDPEIYPKPGNETFIEVQLEENIDTQANINIWLDEYQVLSFQSYTELVGGLIEDSDTLRHNVTISQEGGNMCVSIVELIFGGGTSLNYKSGDIELSSQDACLKFRDGAKLIIDNTDMIYGYESGAGMMALEAGSEVRLKGNSSLVYNNTLAILAFDTKDFIDIYLERGQSLSFSKTGHVISFSNAFIRVHMNGGKIDLSELNEDEKSKFIFVYPEPKPTIAENIKIFPNPVINLLGYTYNSKDKQIANGVRSDRSGRKIFSGKSKLNEGINDIQIPISTLESGTYFFTLTTDLGIITKSIVKF